MRNLLFGISLYLLFLILTWSQFHILEAVVLFSILVFIPIIFLLLDWRRRDGVVLPLAKWTMLVYPLASGSAFLAFVIDSSFFAIVWFTYTILVAVLGISRVLERGVNPLPELAIDSGLIYLSLGGFWFVATVMNMQVMDFSPYIIFLTAVHFHYSALVIPIMVGLLGRLGVKYQRLYTAVTMIIIVSPMTVAIGITYSRMIEFVAVVIYLVAFYLYGYLVLTATFKNVMAKILVSVSALILLITIAFSLYYAYGRVTFSITLSIDQMVWIHGVVNAFGVILPALIGWSLERPSPSHQYYGKPMSRVLGERRIGSDYLLRRDLIEQTNVIGLVDNMQEFSSKSFDASKISTTIINFYERTHSYTMRANIQWKPWFRPLASIYNKISRKVGQIHLGLGSRWEGVNGNIVDVKSTIDGRERVRAWIRENEQSETIFMALYSTHEYKDETYMNIALPLPYSNMTGILRLRNDGRNLILTSSRDAGNGDSGIYLHTSWMTIRLPLEETFYIKESDRVSLVAHHQMWIFGLKFLEIGYEIEKMGLSEK
ncbi:YndJ family protein [Bacillus sp. JJ722]|uniref:YndJ family protein n=1 Tax=Bacillus sp. JJ722 TaxID=3122973 RepID=UPI002FFF7761